MSKDLTSGSPWRRIAAFTAPVILGNLFQQVYSLADTVIVGRTIGPDALAAVGATSIIVYFVLCFVQGMTGGFSILLGQRYGAGSAEGVQRSAAASVLLSAALSVVLTALSVGLCRPILRWMRTPLDIWNCISARVRRGGSTRAWRPARSRACSVMRSAAAWCWPWAGSWYSFHGRRASNGHGLRPLIPRCDRAVLSAAGAADYIPLQYSGHGQFSGALSGLCGVAGDAGWLRSASDQIRGLPGRESGLALGMGGRLRRGAGSLCGVAQAEPHRGTCRTQRRIKNSPRRSARGSHFSHRRGKIPGWPG